MTSPVVAGKSSNIQKLYDLEKAKMADGSLSAKDIKALEKAAKTKAEKALVKQMLSHDAFDATVTNKTKKSVKATRSAVVGQAVGNTSVTRSFSPAGGYLDRNQAIGAARLSGSANAAVVQDAKGHWHAVETKEPLSKNSKTALAVKPLDSTKLEEAIKKYDELKASDKTIEKPETIAALKEWASQVYGVPASEINVVYSAEKMKPGMININANSNADGAEGVTSKSGSKDGITPNGVHVSALRGGATRAATTLFHEGQHASDHERYFELKKEFDGLNPKPTNPQTKQPMSFGYWLSTQETKGKISATEHQRVEGDDRHDMQETHAHVQSFMAAFKKDLGTALGELYELNNDFKNPDKNVAKLNAPELRSFFDSLNPVDQKTFKAVYDKVVGQGGMAAEVMKQAFPDGLELAAKN